MKQNVEVWHHWGVLNEYDRPPASGFGGIPTISSQAVRDYCRDFSFSELDYKKILIIEKAFKKAMYKKQEKKERIEKNKSEFDKKIKRPMPSKIKR